MGFDFTVYKGSSDGSIKKATTHRDDLQGDSVLVRITHSGVCFTDVHYMKADMALGHEGAGVVEATGPGAQHLKKGDRVGWGYEHDSCGSCKQCLTGWETFCPERKFYGYADLDQGSFATHAVWREAFLFKIPDALAQQPGRGAADVRRLDGVECHRGRRSEARVARGDRGDRGPGPSGHPVCGQDGLRGGCVLRQRQQEGGGDEAGRVRVLCDQGRHGAQGRQAVGQPHHHDQRSARLEAIPSDSGAGRGHLPSDGGRKGSANPIHLPLLVSGIRIQGGIVAARQSHRDMLDFAAHHGTKPIIMTYPMSVEGIQECLKTLQDGKMRYRGVLVADKQ